MTLRARHGIRHRCVLLALLALSIFPRVPAAAQREHRYLYVGVPASETDQDVLGILIFDVDNDHKLVRRLSPGPLSLDGARRRAAGDREHVRGIAADVRQRRIYLSTVERIVAINLLTERVVWEKAYGGHCCDRLDVSPDGRTIYAPAFGAPRWYVINSSDGELIGTIDVAGWPRQTIYSRDGMHAYLSAWESHIISVADTTSHKVIKEVGPFTNFVCPFTVNSRGTLAFANVDGLVGFEVADLQTGLVLDRVIVEGFDTEQAARYECPSHGIALTADERELWVADGVDNRLHIFDATAYPPVAARTIQLRAQPRWMNFSVDGRYAYASSEVIDTASKAVVATLKDEDGVPVHSGKLIQINWF